VRGTGRKKQNKEGGGEGEKIKKDLSWRTHEESPAAEGEPRNNKVGRKEGVQQKTNPIFE